MIEDKNEDKYEQPTITQIVHALIIYGLVVIVGFFLLIGLANQKQPNQDKVFFKRGAMPDTFQETWLCRRDKTGDANCQLETGSDCWPPQPPVLRVLNNFRKEGK